jgi:hypothetical protein
MFGSKKEKRFEIVFKEGGLERSYVIKDTKTGVCYFYHAQGYAGGLTVLVDRDGKPLVE